MKKFSDNMIANAVDLLCILGIISACAGKVISSAVLLSLAIAGIVYRIRKNIKKY